jgi:hypothetical protein
MLQRWRSVELFRVRVVRFADEWLGYRSLRISFPGVADGTYVEPLRGGILATVFKRERHEASLPRFAGQRENSAECRRSRLKPKMNR